MDKGIYLNSLRGLLTYDIYKSEIQYQSDLEDTKKKWHSFTISLHNMDVLIVVQFSLQSYLFREYN